MGNPMNETYRYTSSYCEEQNADDRNVLWPEQGELQLPIETVESLKDSTSDVLLPLLYILYLI